MRIHTLLRRARLRAGSQDGFTLLELLITIVVLAVLAAIAIPTLLGQKSKSSDVRAKATVREAARAIETCALDTGGVYNRPGSTCDKAELLRIEPSLADSGTLLDDPVLTSSTYRVTVWSKRAPSDVSFSIRRESDGSIDRSCTIGSKDNGGCLTPGGAGDDW
jgi:type IV pilus assembly protein PilA